MVEITYQMMLSTIQTVSLIVSIIYYITIMRNSQKTQQQALDSRRTQLFLQFYGSATPEMIKHGSELLSWEWEDYEEFNVKYFNDLDARVWWSLDHGESEVTQYL